MQTQWTRGLQPHSFQKRARATLARLELAALACLSEASSLPPKLKFSRTVQAENLRKTDNSAPLPTCTCCAVHAAARRWPMAWPPFRRSVRTAHGADVRINWPWPCKARARGGKPRALWRKDSLRKRLRFARNGGRHRNARRIGGSCLSDLGSSAG